MEDGFLRLLESCFRPDEFVAIAPAAESEEGEIAPRRGVTLTAAELKAKLEKKGGIDRVFGTKLGLFLLINPMCKDGSRNEEVTALRHVLVEFDRDEAGKPIPKAEQYAAVVASGMPMAALAEIRGARPVLFADLEQFVHHFRDCGAANNVAEHLPVFRNHPEGDSLPARLRART